MRDEIIRATAKGAPIRCMAITAPGVVERARQIHKTLPVVTAALGRTMMATAMMGNDLKVEDGSVTARIDGGGPTGILLAVADAQGNVRGYVQHPDVDIPSKYPGKLDVGGAVGKDGYLTIIKDLFLWSAGRLQKISHRILQKVSRCLLPVPLGSWWMWIKV